MAGAYSRRSFLQRGAAALGGLALLDPTQALAGPGHHRPAGDPRPIPGGLDSNGIPTPDPTQAFIHPSLPGPMQVVRDTDFGFNGTFVTGPAVGSGQNGAFFH